MRSRINLIETRPRVWNASSLCGIHIQHAIRKRCRTAVTASAQLRVWRAAQGSTPRGTTCELCQTQRTVASCCGMLRNVKRRLVRRRGMGPSKLTPELAGKASELVRR